jgi:hypothetical protein
MLSKPYVVSTEEMNSRGQGACFKLLAGLVFGACLEQVMSPRKETAEYASYHTQIDAEAAQGFSTTVVSSRSDS